MKSKKQKACANNIVDKNSYFASVLNKKGELFPLYKTIMETADDIQAFRIGRVTVQMKSSMNDPKCLCFRPYAQYGSSNLELKRSKELKRLSHISVDDKPIKYPESDLQMFNGYTILMKNGYTILDVIELGVGIMINRYGYVCNACGMKDQRIQHISYEREVNSNMHLSNHDIMRINIAYRSGIKFTVWYYADDPVYSYYVLHSKKEEIQI